GLGAYNGGEGNPNLAYADSVIALRAKWRGGVGGAVAGSDGVGASGAAVHRDPRLTTPYMKGAGGKGLQQAANHLGGQLPFTKVQLRNDSEFGSLTAQACSRVAFALGLSDRACADADAGTVIQLTQQLIRDPSGLSAEDRRRATARRPILKRRFEAHQ